MRIMVEQLSQLVTINREKGTFPSQTELDLNVGSSSMRPLADDIMKRVNAITLLRSGRLIDHNLEELMNVPIQLSPSLSPPSLPKNDFASGDAIDSIPVDSSSSQSTDLVDPRRLSKTSPGGMSQLSLR